MPQIDLLVQNGFFATGVTVTIDALASANAIFSALNPGEQAPFSWRLLSESGADPVASAGLPVPATGAWEESTGDVVLIFGIGMADVGLIQAGVATAEGRGLVAQVRAHHDRGALIGASCSSTFFLAEAGVLDRGPATTSWWLGPLFQRRYPAVDLQADAMITEHERVICAGAAMAQLDLALHLIRRFAGMELARACARYLVMDERRGSQAPYLIVDHLARHDPVVSKAEGFIRENLRGTIEIPDLASRCGVSARTLARRFASSTGLTPARFIRRSRAERAANLLVSTDWSVSRIADEVGYAEEGALRRAFYDHFDISPKGYRRRSQS